MHKEYARISPSEDDGHGEGEEGKKGKTPNMNRQLKSRLQKLVEKTDDT